LIRQELIQKQLHEGQRVAGAMTLVYDDHNKEVLDKDTDKRLDFQDIIISTQHLHPDHHNCLEITAVKGAARDIQRLTNRPKAIKSLRNGALSISSSGREV
jgi:CopG family nickel-responsive transcriptional regulator